MSVLFCGGYIIVAMLRPLDTFLNNITMYRLVYYGLLALLGVAVILGFTGHVPYSGWAILWSALWLLVICRVANVGLAKLFGAATNFESPAITALILAFIMAPATQWTGLIPLTLVGVLAMASKYLFNLRGRHIFNPAAIALVIMGLLGSGQALWWIATPALLPATVILGLLVVRKLQRFRFVTAAIATALVTMLVIAATRNSLSFDIITQAFTSWPLVFFATIMLTEPATMPPVRRWRLPYAVLIGWLFASQLHVGLIPTTPEVVLVIGNALSFLVSRGYRVRFRLTGRRKIAADTYEFSFQPDRQFKFAAGQYLEWTLPHPRADERGSRRYFTIAASPTEKEVHLGLKIGPGRTSSFKTALKALPNGAILTATGPGGDFVLPHDPSRKLVWLAGGIGITPFRSMVQYLLDHGEHRDIALLFLAARPDGFAYRELFDQAANQIGFKPHYILTSADVPPDWTDPHGPLTAQLLTRLVPDFRERHFYLSGPSGLVRSQRRLLRSAGVARNSIATDDFPGF
jgi:glycine betaine catabolism B